MPTISAVLKLSSLDALSVALGSVDPTGVGGGVVVVDVKNVEGKSSESVLDGNLVGKVEDLSAGDDVSSISLVSVDSLCWVVSAAVADFGEFAAVVPGFARPKIFVSKTRT